MDTHVRLCLATLTKSLAPAHSRAMTMRVGPGPTWNEGHVMDRSLSHLLTYLNITHELSSVVG